jgi:hypothetical protein
MLLLGVAAASLFLGGPRPAAAMSEADRLWLVGERASQDGLPTLSARMLDGLIERFPGDARVPEANLLLGKARLAMGALPGALEAFRRAQGASPPPGKPEGALLGGGDALPDEALLRGAGGVRQGDRRQRGLPLRGCSLRARLEPGGLKQRRRRFFRQLIRAFPDHETMPSAAVQAARLLTEMKSYTRRRLSSSR